MSFKFVATAMSLCYTVMSVAHLCSCLGKPLNNIFCRISLKFVIIFEGIGGWSGGAMGLGKLPVPGRPTIWITVGQGPTTLAVGSGGGCLDIFALIYPFSPIPPSLWDTARYRLKYCLKGPLNPKTTNQPIEGIVNKRVNADL